MMDLFTSRQRPSAKDTGLKSALGFLNRLDALAGSDQSRDTACADILSEVCRHTGWPIGHLYVQDPAAPDHLISAQIWHIAPEVAAGSMTFKRQSEATRFAPGKGLIGGIALAATPKTLADVHVAKGFLRAASAREAGVHGFFGIPVIVAGSTVAVAEFFSRETAALDETTAEIVRFISGQLARIFERDSAASRQAALRASFEQRMGETVSRLNDVALELITVAEQVAAGAHQIDGSADASRQSAAETAAAISQMRGELDSLDQMTGDLHQRVEATQDAVAKVSRESEAGGKSLSEVIDHARSMEEITSSVGEVAARTRMLGLNAAIEAERAGSFGQGFRVVANEIKELASQSSSSTRQVQAGLTALKPVLGKAHTVLLELGAESGRVEQNAATMRDMIDRQTGCQQEVSSAANEVDANMSRLDTALGELSLAAAENQAVSKQLEGASGMVRQFCSDLSAASQSFLSELKTG